MGKIKPRITLATVWIIDLQALQLVNATAHGLRLGTVAVGRIRNQLSELHQIASSVVAEAGSRL